MPYILFSLKKKFSTLFCLTLFLFPFLTSNAFSSDWPQKPIQIIIPWAPTGDPSTILFTAMLPALEEELGVPVKIVNIVGGGGVIGVNEVLKAKPDGYTFGLGPVGPTITQVILGNTPYTTEDLFPISVLYFNAPVLATKSSSPYSNLDELAAYAQNHKVRLAINSIGDARYHITENIARRAGFKWEVIAFQELSPLILLQDSADIVSYVATPFIDYVKKGDIKILATLLPERSTAFPDVPTAQEQGYGEALAIWAGLLAPKGTPYEIAEEFRRAFVKCFMQPEIIEILNRMGAIAEGSTIEEAQKRLLDETVIYSEIIESLGLQ